MRGIMGQQRRLQAVQGPGDGSGEDVRAGIPDFGAQKIG